jgi:predicted RNA-binding protein Jag
MAGSIYEGKTYDEAVRKGLEALRLTRAEAVITTIEEGKGGFLGIGARPYRVSVARRPGGAIREPSERPSEDRRGRRGGREERPAARGGRRGAPERGREPLGAGRPVGEERSTGARGRGGRDRSAVAGGAPGKRSRDEAGERPRAGKSTAPAAERAPRASDDRPAPPRREERVREERGREERGREERVREARPAREPGAHTPQPTAEARPAAPITGAAGPGAEGDDGARKRRRRGRRGGRGRRRGPAGTLEGAAAASEGPVLNGDSAMFDDDAAPEHEAPAHAAGPEPVPASAPSPPPAMASSLPAAPAPTWEPAPVPARSETEPEPAYAARDTMARPERERRRDRGERPRARPENEPDMNADELSSTSRRLTEELLKAMGFEPRVSVRAEGNRVDVIVEVDRDDDLLNGHQGDTRQALQHLLNRFLNKGDGSRYHLQLEVNDHWQQRETELAGLAHQLAEDAVTRQVEVVSDLLNSQERRIVHMTLREDGRVKTYSLGSGAVKRVAVAPASFPDRSEDDPAS